MKSNLGRLGTLFWVFFSISAVALGGGLTMLPIMSREFVEKRGWLTDNDMIDTVAVMQSMPGIIAVNMGVLIGYRIAGVIGAVFSVLGVIMPPSIIILAIAAFMNSLSGSETLDHIFLGVRAAVSAMILLSSIKMGKQIIKGKASAIIAIAGFIAMVFFDMNAILLVIVAALVGLSLAYIPPCLKKRAEKEDGK